MSEPVVIRCRENGPLLVTGPVQILDHQGNAFTIPAGKPSVALCRCGQSKNKPFCDSTHKTCGFDSMLVAFDMQPPAPKPGA